MLPRFFEIFALIGAFSGHVRLSIGLTPSCFARAVRAGFDVLSVDFSAAGCPE